ncbi:hypothetical protein FB451DRAFT_1084414 [Mycena latifolia]|nr:hypothetical protein FB451DRAFT_1084414 [Mycena latifolia]
MDRFMSSASADSRRETIRKERIEAEQRRRDELRAGYARLKDTLPTTNQKLSKISLLDRATNHVQNLELAKNELEKRLVEAESEIQRLRHINEMALSTPSYRHQLELSSIPPTPQDRVKPLGDADMCLYI